ncbi:unnamed protein product [Moneuplotes crassus]|uniref:DUSP domain-containing protein n=1 Tax=Euplotes crassus TaxID=5936 RepID=A0AAD1U749_EUPCR|nr:unnamed protein product [Moneuplotes crassus]
MNKNTSLSRHLNKIKAKSPVKYYFANKFKLDVDSLSIPSRIESFKMTPSSKGKPSKVNYKKIENMIDEKLKIMAKDLYKELYSSLTRVNRNFKCDRCSMARTEYITPEKSFKHDKVRKSIMSNRSKMIPSQSSQDNSTSQNQMVKVKDSVKCNKPSQNCLTKQFKASLMKKAPQSEQKASNRISINLASLSSCRGDEIDERDFEHSDLISLSENKQSLFSTQRADNHRFSNLNLSSPSITPHGDCKDIPCGNLCPQLSPRSQRNIILSNSGYQNKRKKSVNLAKKTQIGVPYQMKNTTTFSVKRDIENKKFAIEANWWHQWCDYVNLEHSEQQEMLNRIKGDSESSNFTNLLAPKHGGDEDSIEPENGVSITEELGIPTPIIKTNLNDTKNSCKKLLKAKSTASDYIVQMNTEDLYEKPENICNKKIAELDEKGEFQIKSDCCESYDYVLVNINIWDYLKRWYDYDIEVEVKS